MKTRKREIIGAAFSVIAIVLMLIVEQIIAPPYYLKSILKVGIFGGTMLIFGLCTKQSFKSLLGIRKFRPSALLFIAMGSTFLGILILFVLFKGQLDLPDIRTSLMEKEHLTKGNCIFVLMYILICNSFLEEAFFRGFLFGLFKQMGLKKTGYIFSGIAFALYHIGIVSGWFNIIVFLLSIAGLAFVGIILQLVDEKYGSTVAGWMIHACANLGINTIGVILIFGSL